MLRPQVRRFGCTVSMYGTPQLKQTKMCSTVYSKRQDLKVITVRAKDGEVSRMWRTHEKDGESEKDFESDKDRESAKNKMSEKDLQYKNEKDREYNN